MAIRKNKKRIDPRYFLHETAHRDELDENVPNIDFQRRAHGGKTCGEWSEKIARLRKLYDEAAKAETESYSNRDGELGKEARDEAVQDGINAEIAQEALGTAMYVARVEQKCQVDRSMAPGYKSRGPQQPPTNKFLQLLKDFGEDFKNWPRDMAELLDRYYGHGKMETDRWERERRAR
jgi:hypothetical protein